MTNGFSSTVTFSTAGLPTGATPGFTTASRTTSGTTNLTIATTGSLAAGTYPVTIKGTSGSLVQSFAVTLIVAADFTIATSSGHDHDRGGRRRRDEHDHDRRTGGLQFTGDTHHQRVAGWRDRYIRHQPGERIGN
ncbi:MAG TPA: hypothetical protein VGI83_00585 [Gemmatimonadales bacterium]|jgi:hypothetical protein